MFLNGVAALRTSGSSQVKERREEGLLGYLVNARLACARHGVHGGVMWG